MENKLNKQVEITENTPLLLDNGNLNAVGWARDCKIIYDREKISFRHRIRRKEWDFYQSSDGEWMIQLNFANIAIGSVATAGLVNLKTGERYDAGKIIPFTVNRYLLSSVNANGISNFDFIDKDKHMSIKVAKEYRELRFSGKYDKKDWDIYLKMYHLQPEHQSITIATPFQKPHQFFLTTKFNMMQTEGYARIDGKEIINFSKDKTWSVLDWGRGVWPHKNYWYWGNGSTLIDGKPFGFEITWGIGNIENATETAVFYDGKCHKVGAVDIVSPPKTNGWMKPWEFISDDGKFNLTMTPFFDNASSLGVKGILGMFAHQVHGYYNGTVTLEDGSILKIENMYAFCEYVENLW